MPTPLYSRRRVLGLFAQSSAAFALGLNVAAAGVSRDSRGRKEFNVLDFGAKGDGSTLDSAAVQQAIDHAAAEAGGGRVVVPGGKRFLVGTLVLKSGIDFHLADDAELLASTRAEDYTAAMA